MKINFTKKQYETLIRSMEVGRSVYGILGDMVSDDYKKQSDEIEALWDSLLKLASEFGLDKMTEEFEGQTMLSDKLSAEFDEVQDDYNNDVFWHELETRLGKRDFEQSITPAELKVMAENDGWYPARIYEFWGDELEENGIERLGIVENLKKDN